MRKPALEIDGASTWSTTRYVYLRERPLTRTRSVDRNGPGPRLATGSSHCYPEKNGSRSKFSFAHAPRARRFDAPQILRMDVDVQSEFDAIICRASGHEPRDLEPPQPMLASYVESQIRKSAHGRRHGIDKAANCVRALLPGENARSRVDRRTSAVTQRRTIHRRLRRAAQTFSQLEAERSDIAMLMGEDGKPAS